MADALELQKTHKPAIQVHQVDLAHAKVGTACMLAKIALSPFLSDEILNDPTKSTPLKFLDDGLRKIRQESQYSIHARPGSSLQSPDDIHSDLVHNLEAAALGKSVYQLNAFLAPWLLIAKTFFPFKHNFFMGFIPRLLDFADNTIGKLTNIFWNLRRITMGLLPYDGGLSSQALLEKQNEVRDLFRYYFNRHILKPTKGLLEQVPGLRHQSDQLNLREEFLLSTEDRVVSLRQKSLGNYLKNLVALFSSNYVCPHDEDGTVKRIGTDEPTNHPLFVRSKILSKVLSLPAGLGGTVLNISSIFVNFLGSVLDSQRIRKVSDRLTDYANAMMALVYLTGEVPANINKYFYKKHTDSDTAKRNLLVAGIGSAAMLNRIKILPGFSFVMRQIGLKKILDTFHRQLEHCFLLFFSLNRLVIHTDEKAQIAKTSSAEALEKAKKHENWWSHFTLPFRVIFMDDEVTYKKSTFLKAKEESNPSESS